MAKKAKTKRAAPVEWVQVWNELKVAEGGAGGAYCVERMKDLGIPARTCHSVFVGHIGIEVPAKFEKRATRYFMKDR